MHLDVRALGRLNSAEELAQVYYSSDVFVSPSADGDLWHGLGRSSGLWNSGGGF